jgi:phage terminase small subunit
MSTEEKEEFFCREFIIDLNGTAAFKRVKPKVTDKTAATESCRLLRKPKIKRRIQELMNERSERVEITADKVLRELYHIAMSDIGEAFNEDGSIKKIHDIPLHLRKAMSAVKVDELFDGFGKDKKNVGYTKEIRFWDKNKSLENLAKHLKLFTSDNNTGSFNLNINYEKDE